MVNSARRAVPYALVKGVPRSLIDREYPLVIATSGPYVAHTGSDPSLVRYVHSFAYRRSLGLPPLLWSVSVCRIRMPLRSALVVSISADYRFFPTYMRTKISTITKMTPTVISQAPGKS